MQWVYHWKICPLNNKKIYNWRTQTGINHPAKQEYWGYRLGSKILMKNERLKFDIRDQEPQRIAKPKMGFARIIFFNSSFCVKVKPVELHKCSEICPNQLIVSLSLTYY